MRSPAATPSSIRLASWRSPSAVSRFTRPISFRYIRTVSEVPPLESVRSVLGGRTGRAGAWAATTSSSTSTVADGHHGRRHGRRWPTSGTTPFTLWMPLAVVAARLVDLDDADALAGEGDLDGLEDVVGELDVLQDLHDLFRVELAARPTCGQQAFPGTRGNGLPRWRVRRRIAHTRSPTRVSSHPSNWAAAPARLRGRPAAAPATARHGCVCGIARRPQQRRPRAASPSG